MSITKKTSGLAFSHFGVHNADKKNPIAINSNAGDTALFQAVRDTFDFFMGENEWIMEALWKKVTEEKVKEINEKSTALIVGGGGLLLKDQKGADVSSSGWQWNCPLDLIHKLKVPTILFAVGYNRFRGQEDFDQIFGQHISELLKNSTFFGLRNHGSIDAVKKYVPSNLREKIRFQPCPTTLSWFLYNDVYHLSRNNNFKETKRLVVNMAFDRKHLRFLNNEDETLKSTARVLKKYRSKGWSIILANHKPQDDFFSQYLTSAGVSFEKVNLYDEQPKVILDFYNSVDLVIGMRGHSQMIPFGLRKNIISIISHSKLKWFLDDIGHSDWGVDISDKDYENKLYFLIRQIGETDYDKINKEIIVAQTKLWKITQENMRQIKNSLQIKN